MNRNPLVTWQYEQIEAECALLTGHATDPSCPCESDTENCIRKHLLTIEALAKETYPMDISDQGKQGMADLADQARAWRKQIEQLTIGNPGGNPPPAQPFRIEETDSAQVRIYKEQSEFHGGSFRTIKPDEETLVLVGCPVDRAKWTGTECVCQDTGERGCMELHSITRNSPGSNPGSQKKSAKPGIAEIEGQVEETRAEIEGLEQTIKSSKIKKLIPIWHRIQRRKDQNPALTLKEYRDYTGKAEPPATSLTPDKKHVLWRDALDSVVTEYGYEDTEALMEGLNQLGAASARLQKLRSELSNLKRQSKEIEASPTECQIIKLDSACPVFPGEACRSEITECDGLSFGLVRQPSYWVGSADGKPQFVQRYARGARKEMREVVKPFKGVVG